MFDKNIHFYLYRLNCIFATVLQAYKCLPEVLHDFDMMEALVCSKDPVVYAGSSEILAEPPLWDRQSWKNSDKEALQKRVSSVLMREVWFTITKEAKKISCKCHATAFVSTGGME